MKIIEITVSISHKTNLGNYESEDTFVALKASPDSDEDAVEVARQLFRSAKGLVKEAAPADLVERARRKAEDQGQGSS
jgi:hypothetical protein